MTQTKIFYFSQAFERWYNADMAKDDAIAQIKTNIPIYEKALADKDSAKIFESGLLVLFAPQYTCLDSALEAISATNNRLTGRRKNPEEIKTAISDILSKANDLYSRIISDVKEYAEGRVDEETLLWDINELMLQLCLYDKRQEILSWPEKIGEYIRDRHYTKCVIKAPMGLGKSYAIAKALARSNYSAVIFMPNIDLRKAMADRIRALGVDVLEIEGIDEENCPKYRQIVSGRDKHFNNKAAICAECEDIESCDTKNHKKAAHHYRVLVTTHAQYEAFYDHENEFLRGYTGPVYEDPPETWQWKLRDLFIIDEDIISSHFFECEELTYKEFDSFCEVLREYDGTFDTLVKEKILELRNRVLKATKSSFVLPVDVSFEPSFPDSVKIGKICSKAIKDERVEKKISKIILSAVRMGCMSDSYNGKDTIYFNTGKTFPLSRSTSSVEHPLHVFFDATDVPSWLMNKVFGRGGTGEISIEAKPIGKIIAYHTNNTDLPRTLAKDLQAKVDTYLTNIIRKHGQEARYFVATTGSGKTKTSHSGYEYSSGQIFEREGVSILGKGIDDNMESAIKQVMRAHNHNYAVIRHYGHLRGTNVAIHCDIGILLGSYKVPDAVEVAWAIPFIQDIQINAPTGDQSRIIPLNQMQTMITVDGVPIRIYNSDFDDINRIVRWRKQTEFEQAIGRTRFLMHDVTIYAVTKDDISKLGVFEDSRVQIKPDEDGLIIFDDRKDSTYLISKIAIGEILKAKDNFTAAEVINKAPEIARVFRTRVPKKEAVGSHVQRYLEALTQKGIRNTRTREGNAVIYKILDWPLPRA